MEFEFDLPVVTSAIRKRRKHSATVVGTVPVTVELGECKREELTDVASVGFSLGDPATRFLHRDGNLYVPSTRVEDMPRGVPWPTPRQAP